MRICVYGAASEQIASRFKNEAYELGKRIAESGGEIVYGGGSTGVMGAVSRGAKEAGGKVIGIAPRFFDAQGVLDKNVTELIFTDTMRERKARMEEMADAFVMAPGGIGTFEEFFEILTLRQLSRHDKPIAVLNTDGYYSPLDAFLRQSAQRGFIAQENLKLYEMCENAADVVSYFKRALACGGKNV